MKIVSCGDSFFYGSDLQDTKKTWPSLMANMLDADYHCMAIPGVGNSLILQQIIQAYHDHGDEAIYLINWTWIDRFDYVSIQDDKWHTVRPSLDNPELDGFYYRNFHSELADKFQSLVYIAQAQDILKNSRYIMTYMDHLLLDQRWHAPDYVRYLQYRIQSCLDSFDGKNFLEWSRELHYPISEKWHPLEEAHSQAANYWLPHIRSL